MFLKVSNTSIEVQVVWKRLNCGGSYSLEIPLIYRFYGQGKLVNCLIKKTEAEKKELECKVSKYLKQILTKPFNFVIFSVLVSKNFELSGNWREKNAKFTNSWRK